MSRASPSLQGLVQPLLLHGDFAGSSLHGEDASANTLPSDDDGESDGIVAQFAAANKAGPACHCLSAFKDPELERRYQVRMATLLFWPTVSGEVFIMTSTMLVSIAYTLNMWDMLEAYDLFGVPSGAVLAHLCIVITTLLIFLTSIALTLVPWIVGTHPHRLCDPRRCRCTTTASRAEHRRRSISNPTSDVEAALDASEGFHPEHHPDRVTRDVPQCYCCARTRGGGIKFCTMPLATGLPERVGRCRTRAFMSYSTLLMTMVWNVFIPLTNALFTFAKWNQQAAAPAASCPAIGRLPQRGDARQALESGIGGLLESVLSQAGTAGAHCSSLSVLGAPLNVSALQADVMSCTAHLSGEMWKDAVDYISLAYVTELPLFTLAAVYMEYIVLAPRFSHYLLSIVWANVVYITASYTVYANEMGIAAILFRPAVIIAMSCALLFTTRVQEINNRFAFFSLLTNHQLTRELREATTLLETVKEGIETDLTVERQRPLWMIDLDELKMFGVLGSGSFGVVVRGMWNSIPIAIKIIHKQRLSTRRPRTRVGSHSLGAPVSGTLGSDGAAAVGGEERERRLRQRAHLYTEMSVLSRIRHPHVTLFLGAAERNDQILLVTEYMMGGSLWACLRSKVTCADWDRLGWRRNAGMPGAPRSADPDAAGGLCARMAWQSACGLHHLHASKLLHGDVKSPNILVDSACSIKLADFGTARWLTRAPEELDLDSSRTTPSVAKSFVGTPRWSAPEVMAGGDPTTASDVFSLGVCLWELATRMVPYDEYEIIDSHALMLQIAERGLRPSVQPLVRLGVRPRMIELIESCWKSNPALRPTSGAILDELSAMQASGGVFLPGDPVPARPGLDAGGDTLAESAAARGSEEGAAVPIEARSLSVSSTPQSMLSGEPASDAGASARGGRGNVHFVEGNAIEYIPIPGVEYIGGDSLSELGDAGAFVSVSVRASWPPLDGAASGGGSLRPSESAASPSASEGQGPPAAAAAQSKRAVGGKGSALDLESLARYEVKPQILRAEALVYVGTTNSSVVRGRCLGRAVAIKCFFGRRETRTARMVREAGLLSKLNHPHIIKLVCVFTVESAEEVTWSRQHLAGVFTRSAGDVRLQRGLRTEKLSGIVIEWMSGGDLWELLRKEKLRSADLRSPSCGIARDEFMQAHGGGPGSRRQSPSPGRGDRRGERRSPSPRGKSQAQWNGPRQRRSTLFSLRRQLTIFRQIFEALVYLHEREQPLIHRDLKSANILVRYDLGGEDPVPSDCFHDALDRVAVLANRGSEAELAATASAAAEREVRLSSARAPQPHDAALSAAEVAGTEGWHAKLTDFGLSRTAGLAEYVAMTCCGSPAWTAPEVFRGGQRYSTAIDVYSTAVVMWEVVTGDRPYADSATPVLRLLREIATNRKRPVLPPLPFPAADDAVELVETRKLFGLITACWQDDPAARPTAREALGRVVGMLSALA